MTNTPFPYVQAPEDLEVSFLGITPGKVYRVTDFGEWSKTFGQSFYIVDDRGMARYCLQKFCSVIGHRNWKIPSFEENLKKILQ